MKIMKSQIDAAIVLSEITGYRKDANFTVRLSRVSLAGETAWSVTKSSEFSATEVCYFSDLASALNEMSSVIRDNDERKQLLRALI